MEFGNAQDARKAVRNLVAVGEKVAAIIVEPIQGEAGVIVPPAGYLAELREICDEYVSFHKRRNGQDSQGDGFWNE